MRLAWVVFKKELLDALRDRRALFSVLILPLLGPLMVAMTLKKAVDEQVEPSRVNLPTIGAEHAPGLVRYLEERRITIEPAPDDAIAAVKTDEAKMVLWIPDDYAKKFSEARSVRLRLVTDRSRMANSSARHRVEAALRGYSRTVGVKRLMMRGVDPGIAQPLTVNTVDVATPKQRSAIFLNVVVMFIMIASVVGGMYVATDSLAGERERKSLEPLLITPTRRRDLVIGKWLTAATFAVVTVLLTTVAAVFALRMVPSEKIGFVLTISPASMLTLMAIVLPMAAMMGALQLLVAAFSRTTKEAQTYQSLLLFAPMIPSMVAMVKPSSLATWKAAVPVWGHQLLMKEAVVGQPLSLVQLALAIGVSVAVTAGALAATTKLLNSERAVFGR